MGHMVKKNKQSVPLKKYVKSNVRYSKCTLN